VASCFAPQFLSLAWHWHSHRRSGWAGLILANALVTLDRTMWGIAMKHVKTGMLLAATVALTLAWTFLPHPFFGIVVACAAIGALSVVLGINALRQLSGADPPLRSARS